MNNTQEPPVFPFAIGENQHYGVFQSPEDKHDHPLAAYVAINAEAQPVSYWPHIEPIPTEMQSKLGACVGHAAQKSQQCAEYQETGEVIKLSPRWLYAMAKCMDGYQDEGTYPRLVAQIMKNYGCATEATVPNDTTLEHEVYCYQRKMANIPAEAFEEAKKIKISNYAFPKINETEIKAAIQFAGEHRGGIFVLVKIDKAWWTTANGQITWAEADVLPLREPVDVATLGGHEVYFYAFDVKDGRTIIIGRNSWSRDWCAKSGVDRVPNRVSGDFWFYLDEWLPYIVEVVTTIDLDDNYVAPNWTYNFTQVLHQGMKGGDVVALQHALRIDGEFTYPQLTGNFKEVTLQAVKDFQLKYSSEILAPAGLTEPTGFVGVNTLKKLNQLFGQK